MAGLPGLIRISPMEHSEMAGFSTGNVRRGKPLNYIPDVAGDEEGVEVFFRNERAHELGGRMEFS